MYYSFAISTLLLCLQTLTLSQVIDTDKLEVMHDQEDAATLMINDEHLPISDGSDLLLPAYVESHLRLRGGTQIYLVSEFNEVSASDDNKKDYSDVSQSLANNNLKEKNLFKEVELDLPEEELQDDIGDKIELDEEFEAMSNSSSIYDMLRLVNSARKRAGVRPLCLNRKLNSAAQKHTNDMMKRNFFSHYGSDGSIVSNRVNRYRYKWRRLAENIAINSSISGAHTAFMNSSGHRRNVLNPKLTQIGIGKGIQTSGKYKGRLYVTQVFAESNTERC